MEISVISITKSIIDFNLLNDANYFLVSSQDVYFMVPIQLIKRNTHYNNYLAYYFQFGLMCRIPVLMLSFLGYVNNISQIIGTLVTGLLSDL